MHDRHIDQVRLLLRALMVIAEETAFALKGGTAINLFYLRGQDSRLESELAVRANSN